MIKKLSFLALAIFFVFLAPIGGDLKNFQVNKAHALVGEAVPAAVELFPIYDTYRITSWFHNLNTQIFGIFDSLFGGSKTYPKLNLPDGITCDKPGTAAGPLIGDPAGGIQVLIIQQFLNHLGDDPYYAQFDNTNIGNFRVAKSGPGSPGNETENYGPATSRAVGHFQVPFGEGVYVYDGSGEQGNGGHIEYGGFNHCTAVWMNAMMPPEFKAYAQMLIDADKAGRLQGNTASTLKIVSESATVPGSTGGTISGAGSITGTCVNVPYLNLRDTGSDVFNLQKFLLTNGTPKTYAQRAMENPPSGSNCKVSWSAGAIDYYGPCTARAVEFFQNDHKPNPIVSVPVGSVDRATQQALALTCNASPRVQLKTSTGENLITVVSPNGGETWGVGQTHTFKWTSAPGIQKVTINLHNVGGNGYTYGIFDEKIDAAKLDSSTGSGSADWVVRSNNLVPGRYEAIVSSSTNANAYDKSDNLFTIVPVEGMLTYSPVVTKMMGTTLASTTQITLTGSDKGLTYCLYQTDGTQNNRITKGTTYRFSSGETTSDVNVTHGGRFKLFLGASCIDDKSTPTAGDSHITPSTDYQLYTLNIPIQGGVSASGSIGIYSETASTFTNPVVSAGNNTYRCSVFPCATRLKLTSLTNADLVFIWRDDPVRYPPPPAGKGGEWMSTIRLGQNSLLADFPQTSSNQTVKFKLYTIDGYNNGGIPLATVWPLDTLTVTVPAASATAASSPGTCGSSSGAVFTSTVAPTANLCNNPNDWSGKTSVVTYLAAQSTNNTVTGWHWYCSTNGGITLSPLCYSYVSAPSSNPGACGTANGKTYTSPDAPTTSSLCTLGSGALSPQYSGTILTGWQWYCNNSGTLSPLCFAYNQASDSNPGVCGGSNGTTLISPNLPTNFCTRGSMSALAPQYSGTTLTGWQWYCSNSNSGAMSNLCYAYNSAPATTAISAGVCGSANGVTFAPPEVPAIPSLCSTGSGSPVPQYSGSTLTGWQWYCSNSGVMSNLCYAYSSAPSAVPVTCGSSNGKTFTSPDAPTTASLCSTGSGTLVRQYSGTTLTGWQWYCTSTSGAMSNLCYAYNSAPAAVSGTCGSANGVTYTSTAAPVSSVACASGKGTALYMTAQTTSGVTTGWHWYCGSTNGSVTQSSLCYSYVSASTGTAGTCISNSTGPNLCGSNNTLGPNAKQPDGSYQWYCYGPNGGPMSPLCFYTPPAANALSGYNSATNAGSVQGASSFIYVWDRNLEIGSPYAADVKALQTALTREGVYAGEITGGFYNQTFYAVKAFQQKYGIEATGYVGPVTRAKLNALY